MYIAEDTLKNSINNVSHIKQVLDASPVTFQITKKCIEDISQKTKYYLIKNIMNFQKLI